jgi:hypothetical protein
LEVGEPLEEKGHAQEHVFAEIFLEGKVDVDVYSHGTALKEDPYAPVLG